MWLNSIATRPGCTSALARPRRRSRAPARRPIQARSSARSSRSQSTRQALGGRRGRLQFAEWRCVPLIALAFAGRWPGRARRRRPGLSARPARCRARSQSCAGPPTSGSSRRGRRVGSGGLAIAADMARRRPSAVVALAHRRSTAVVDSLHAGSARAQSRSADPRHHHRSREPADVRRRSCRCARTRPNRARSLAASWPSSSARAIRTSRRSRCPQPPASAFDRALAVAQSTRMGDRHGRPGRRADRGHRHDPLVRLQRRRRRSADAWGTGTRVDVRSVSRVRRSATPARTPAGFERFLNDLASGP